MDSLDAFERAVAGGAFVAPRQRGRTRAAAFAASASSACSSPSPTGAVRHSSSSWLLSSAMRDTCEQQIWATGHRVHTAPCSPARASTRTSTASSTSSFAPTGAWLHAFRQRLAHISSYQQLIATPIIRIPRESVPASTTTPTRAKLLHRVLLSSLISRLRSTNTSNKV